MKLRYQLLLISLLLLVLPWSAWQFLKVFDRALRESQSQAMIDQAELIAERLAAEPDLFFAPFITADFNAEQENQAVLYAYSLPNKPLVDGYFDDWRFYKIAAADLAFQDPKTELKILAGIYQQNLYLFITVRDDYIEYFNPLEQSNSKHDHLRLQFTGQNGKKHTYYLQTSAPGQFFASYRDEQGDLRKKSSIRGFWRESNEGYQVELVVDAGLLIDGFTLSIVDPVENNKVNYWLGPVFFKMITPSVAMESFLTKLHDTDFNLSVLNEQQWLIASLKARPKINSNNRAPWVVEWLYRQVLESEHLPDRGNGSYRSQLDYPEIQESLEHGSMLYWYRSNGRGLQAQTLASVAVPIKTKQQLMGFVLLEKSTDQLIALTSSAFNRLFLYTIGAFLVVAVILLTYASWLSMRITRLNRVANNVVNDQGAVEVENYHWPDLNNRDEIGELSRGYRSLLLRLQEYNHYLRTLSSKLSHELRTPIAVVRSSLENISQVNEPELQAEYCERAQQGINRLTAILNAMSAANRIEEIILGATDTDFEQIDLRALLNNLASAYDDAYSEHTVVFIDKLEQTRLVPIVQDLFIQMLDKLIENAADFAPKESTITIHLIDLKQSVCVQVENTGPLLPDSMQGRLFDSMVSLRTAAESGNSTHLGLGLYIVRLIAELHGGEVTAANKSDNTGVIFSITLAEKQ